MMRVWLPDGSELAAGDDGVFRVDEYVRHIVVCDVHLRPSTHLYPLPGPDDGARRYELRFERYIGKAVVGSTRFEVRSAKLDAADFRQLLDDVTREMVDLAFSHDRSTSASSVRDTSSSAPSVPYHAFAYLRAVGLTNAEDGGLVGQFEQIAHNPERRMVRETATRPVFAMADVGDETITALPRNPEFIEPLPMSSPLRTTALAQRLGRGRFPSAVLSSRTLETFDTPANRLVRNFLERATEIVEAVLAAATSPETLDDARVLSAMLSAMRQSRFLDGVGRMQRLPIHSTVLQRRSGYRQVRDHFLRLLDTTSLGPPELWWRLLELKDTPTLYELWCFFQVKGILDARLGAPEPTQLFSVDELQRGVIRARLQYEGGVELAYNRTFAPGPDGSYSLQLRPDISVSIRYGEHHRHVIFDAKLKLEERRPSEEDDLDAGAAKAVAEDIRKMHVYREAISGVEGAFVLYPGTERVYYGAPSSDGRTWFGVGAEPLRPGDDVKELSAKIFAFIENEVGWDPC